MAMTVLRITKKEIREKISLLQDFRIINPQDKTKKEAVKKLLMACETELRASIVLQDVLMGRESLDNLLKRKGIAI